MSTGAPSAMHMKKRGFPLRANLLPLLCAEIGRYTKKGAQDATDRGLRDDVYRSRAYGGDSRRRGKSGITLDAHQKDIVDKVSSYFSGIHTLQGSFMQTGADNQRMKGKFYVQRPGRFRFDYARPSRQIVISDGRYLAVQDLDLNNEDRVELDQTPFRLLLSSDVNLLRDAKIMEVEESNDRIVVALQDKDADAAGTTQALPRDQARTATQGMGDEGRAGHRDPDRGLGSRQRRRVRCRNLQDRPTRVGRVMDAATLYMIVTLPNGEQSTSTHEFPTLEACEAQAELLRTVEPLDRQSPVTSYRCEGHNPIAFVAPYRRGRSRRLVRAFVASSLHRVSMDCLPARPQPQKARLLLRGSPTASPHLEAVIGRNLLRDIVIAFTIGGLFGAGVAIAYGSEDPTQKIVRKCRAAGDTVLVSKCRVMCLMRSGVERDLDTVDDALHSRGLRRIALHAG